MFKLKPHHLLAALLASLFLFCAVPDIAAQNQITPRKQTHQTQQRKRTPAKKNKPPKKQSAPQRQNNSQNAAHVNVTYFDAQFGYQYDGATCIKFNININVLYLMNTPINWTVTIYHQNGNPVYYRNGQVLSYSNSITPPYDDTNYTDMWVTIPYGNMPSTGGQTWNFYAQLTYVNANTGRSINNSGYNRHYFTFCKN